MKRYHYSTSLSPPPYSAGHDWLAEAAAYVQYLHALKLPPDQRIVITNKNEYWPGDGSRWVDGKMVDPPGAWEV